MAEGEGSSEMKSTIVETSSSSIDSSIIFHIVNDILAFSLFMHQQIPSILQDMTFEFDELRSEYKILEEVLALAETKGSIRRKQATRKREVKQGIKRLERIMQTIASVKTALQLMISEIPGVECVTLVLGPSPLRPIHVYEMYFPLNGRVFSGEFGRSKIAESLSKRAIRELISRGAGSNSYAGPTKLFLLVKAPSSFNMPLHFLPKRDFKCNKKILPFKLQVGCKIRAAPLEVHVQKNEPRTASSLIVDSSSNDMIWYGDSYTVF
ncbi:hypothetical protein Leryth_009090 [Lithospermum erythrorhizon]|nr:hypothetical protein Leryth_009090 [Lithospermum erythrorhizon]